MNENVIEFFKAHPEANTIFERGGFLFLHEKNAKNFLEGGSNPITTITREGIEAAKKKEADDAAAKKAEEEKIAADAAAKQKSIDEAAAAKKPVAADKK